MLWVRVKQDLSPSRLRAGALSAHGVLAELRYVPDLRHNPTSSPHPAQTGGD